MMKKVLIATLLFLLCGCSTSNVVEKEGTNTSSKGETTTAKVKFDHDIIKEVELDETTGDTTKKTLGADYHMKDASPIQKEWYEQVKFLEAYIEKNGVDKIELNDEGKAINEDIKTGCTISIDGFLKAIENAKVKE